MFSSVLLTLVYLICVVCKDDCGVGDVQCAERLVKNGYVKNVEANP